MGFPRFSDQTAAFKLLVRVVLISSIFISSLMGIEVNMICSHEEQDPGAMTTLRVFVTTSDAPFTGDLEIHLPAGIIPLVNGRGAVYKAPLNLPENDNQLILVPIRLSPQLSRGTHDIAGILTSDGKTFAEFGCEVKVKSLKQLEVTPLFTGGSILEPGETSKLNYQITNVGNTHVVVELGHILGHKTKGKVEPETLQLAPGQSEAVSLTFEAPNAPKQETVEPFYASLKGTYQSIDGGPTPEKAYFNTVSRFQLLPGQKGGSLYWTIPSRSSIVYLSDDNSDALFLRLQGGGRLFEDRKEYLRWLIQTPGNNVSGGGHNTDERYAFWFGEDNYEIRAGDHYNSVSPLTQLSFYGRGIAADFHHGQYSFNVFGLDQQRNSGLPEEQYGASISYNIDPFHSLKANVLRRNFENGVYADADIVSIESTSKWSDLLQLDAELAYSNSDEEDWAMRVVASGSYEDRWIYNTQFIQANPDYAGYYRDQRSMSYGTSYKLNEKWSLQSSYSRNESNFKHDVTKGFAGVSQLFTAGPFYQVSKDTKVGLEYVDYERRDKISPRSFDYAQTTGRFSVNHRFSQNLRGGGSVEVGEQKNYLTDSTDDFFRARVFANYSPRRGHNYSIFAESGDDRYTDRLTKSHTIGGGASYLINGSTKLYFSGTYTDYENTTIEDQVNVAGRVVHTFPNDHEISAGVRVSRGTRRDIGTPSGEIIEEREYYFITYTIPFDIPVSIRKDVGAVRGVVYADPEMTKPMEGVAVTIEGKKGYSNKNGEFEIPRLRSGNYVVRIDRASIGQNLRPDLPESFMISVESGKASMLEFAIVESARVDGKILLNGNGNGHTASLGTGTHITSLAYGSLDDQVNFSQLVVEITGESEQRTIKAGKNGEFTFYDLLPGNYTVKLYNANLPRGYIIAEETRTLTLEPGESRNVEFKLVPRERKIRIIDEGELTQISMADRKAEKAQD